MTKLAAPPEWDDFATIARIERAERAGVCNALVWDGTINWESREDYRRWRAEYAARQARAEAEWAAGLCCGEREQLSLSHYCHLARGGCWGTERGAAMAGEGAGDATT